jgi:hypothetical protein
MRWHHMLIVYQIWFVSTASLGGRHHDPPTYHSLRTVEEAT